MKAQYAFDRLVTNDFSDASYSDVKTVVLSIWHEDFVPKVKHLDSDSARAASYVLDRLMRYNCVSVEQQQLLLSTLKQLSSKFEVKVEVRDAPAPDRKVDKAARKWGLKNDLKAMLKQMLPFQTRHYNHQPLAVA